jgi:hypothetical protein
MFTSVLYFYMHSQMGIHYLSQGKALKLVLYDKKILPLFLNVQFKLLERLTFRNRGSNAQ